MRSVAFSPDGRTILTGSFDKTARLWDADTGQPIGTSMVHPGQVTSVAFSPDGRTILTACLDKMARLWDADTGQPIGPPMPHPSSWHIMWNNVRFTPGSRYLLTSDGITARLWDPPAPLPDDVPRLAAWVEAATGLELDERGSIRMLDQSAWLERRRRLEQLGGPPPDPAPRLDPILFGGKPSARGDAWTERGQSDRAEAAYAEAIRARPLNGGIASSLAQLHLERGHLDRAAATLAEAVGRMPDDLILRHELGEALLWAGDRSGWRRSIAALLDGSGGTIHARDAEQIARACVLGPEGTADPDVPVRLAEKAGFLNTLGDALYRAGRFDEAIRRLDEAIRIRGGEGQPQDWAFLAMAHHRLGHRDEARQWLDRLREYQPSADPAQFWDELEILLLRGEAEAVVLHDPVFPDDPFAH